MLSKVLSIRPGVGVRSIANSVSVCLFVCLSVRSHISKITSPNFANLSVHVTCGRDSVLLWRQRDTSCTSGFVDDVMFSYNAGNRPESKTTRMFRAVRQMAAPVGRQTTLFGRDRQVAAPGTKFAVSDCMLLLGCLIVANLYVKLLTPLASVTVRCCKQSWVMNNLDGCTRLRLSLRWDAHTEKKLQIRVWGSTFREKYYSFFEGAQPPYN